MNVLVDTSVWSIALRRKPGSLDTAELAELIREGRTKIIGPDFQNYATVLPIALHVPRG